MANTPELRLREEWTVRHAQGVHPGPFTEESARRWLADDIERDKRRQFAVQGRQALLRRYVTEWEEVPLAGEQPASHTDQQPETD